MVGKKYNMIVYSVRIIESITNIYDLYSAFNLF